MEWWNATDNALRHALTTTQQQINAATRDMLELVAEVSTAANGP